MRMTFYHGTAHRFARFTEASIGRGVEPNTALGVHCTDDPAAAADYAQSSASFDAAAAKPVVLVVEADIAQVVPVEDSNQFFGIGGSKPAAKEHFAAERRRLLDLGVDAVWSSDYGDHDIWVVLNPAKLVVTGALTLEAAEETEAAAVPFAGVQLLDRIHLQPA